MSERVIGALVVAACLAAAGPVRADAVDLAAPGMRASAMAGAGVASARGVAAVHDNPAALSWLRGEEFLFSYRLTAYDLEYGDEADQRGMPDEATNAVEIGIAVGDLFGLEGLGVGVYLYLPTGGAIQTVVHKRSHERYFVLFEDGLTTTTLEAALSYRFRMVALSVGVSAFTGLEVETTADMAELTEPAGDPRESCKQLPEAERKSCVEITQGTQVEVTRHLPLTFAFKAGVMVRPLPWLDLSLSFRDENSLHTTGPSNITLGGLKLHELPQYAEYFQIDYLNFYAPRRFTLGVSYHRGPLVVDASLGLHLWSAFRDTQNRRPDPPLSDVLVPSVGLEWTAAKWFTLRAGYSYAHSPVPDQAGWTNLVDCHRHNAALGAALWLQDFPFHGDRTELAVSLQRHFLVSRQVSKDASSLSKSYPKDLLAYRAGGGLLMFGVGLKVGF